MATQNDELPTMPSSEAPPVDANTVVWLVSYDENDDRELLRPQIAAALTRGEIDGNTIVWREGLEDWLPIADVPELAPLLPASGETKDVGEVAPLGFLGTGLQLKTETRERKSVPPPLPRKSEPPKATTAAEPPIANTAVEAPKPAAPEEPSRKSVPPPLPAARTTKQGGDEEAPMSVDPESLGPESFAEAVLSGAAIPKARALSSGTFGVAGGGHVITDAAPSSRPPESDPPPSSGTPSLMALAATHGEEAPKVDDEILALGGTTAPGLMPPPNIDISDIEQTAKNSLTPPTAAASEPPPPAPASARPQSTTTTSSRIASAAPKAARAPVLPWIITAAAVVGAVYAFARRPAPPPETLPVPAAPPPVAAQSRPAPVATEPAAPSPAVPSAEPASSVVATAAPTPSSTPAAATSSKSAPATPTTASGAKPKATAAAPATATPSATPSAAPSASAPTAAPGAPSAASTPSETEPATPFDKGAANAALQSTAAEAASCRKEGDPSGRAVVHVTFANSGRAIRATVEGPPFAGTATGGCIAQVMRKAQVPPFSGDKVTVAKTVNVD